MGNTVKHKVDDKVWLFHNAEKVVEAVITGVKEKSRTEDTVYYLRCPDAKELTWSYFGWCFSTKEECIDFWIKWYEDIILFEKEEIKRNKGYIKDYQGWIAKVNKCMKDPNYVPAKPKGWSLDEARARIGQFWYSVGDKCWVFRSLRPVQVTVLAQPTYWCDDPHSGDYKHTLPKGCSGEWSRESGMFDTKKECVDAVLNDFYVTIERCQDRIKHYQRKVKDYKALITLLKKLRKETK